MSFGSLYTSLLSYTQKHVPVQSGLKEKVSGLFRQVRAFGCRTWSKTKTFFATKVSLLRGWVLMSLHNIRRRLRGIILGLAYVLRTRK